MRDGNFGMYFWKDLTNKPYEVLMMNTEISLNGRNWNPFHYTLKSLPIFANKLTLGDYAYQENELILNNTDIKIKCLNDRYEVYESETLTVYPIKQEDNIDIEDRIEKGKEIIECLLDIKTYNI